MKLTTKILNIICCSILMVTFFCISYNVIKINNSTPTKENAEQFITNITDFIEGTIELNLLLDNKFNKN